jgi:acetyltransferase-like isoleucine patch superfamily enzyme
MGFISDTADIATTAVIPESSSVWHYAQIRENARLGENNVIGRGAYIGAGVEMGDNCKVQNYALLYEPARLGNGVFIGPAVVLTNDEFPRAINPDGSLKSGADWKAVGVTIGEGAAIGANSTCIAPLTVGRWALVGSGSVVTKDVSDFALVVGNPARRIGWVGKTGHRLIPSGDTLWACPDTGENFLQTSENTLVEAGIS